VFLVPSELGVCKENKKGSEGRARRPFQKERRDRLTDKLRRQTIIFLIPVPFENKMLPPFLKIQITTLKRTNVESSLKQDLP